MLIIIVNADDAGISREVNQAIFELMSRKQLFSTTLLANGPALEEAVARIPAFPDCSFGVHLNLSQFRPLSNHPGLAPLLDERGEFNNDIIRRLRPSPGLLRGVYAEWCAQLDRVREAGVTISHLDSHQHVHTCPTLFPVLKMIQKRYGIRKVRNTRNFYGPSVASPSRSARLSKAVWSMALRVLPPRTRTTNVFTNVRDFFATPACGVWAAAHTVELMTHPGNPGSGDEVEGLRTDWRAAPGCGGRLVSYHELDS